MGRQRVAADQKILNAVGVERPKQHFQVVKSGRTAVFSHRARATANFAIPWAKHVSQ